MAFSPAGREKKSIKKCGCFSARHKTHELKPFSLVYGEHVRRLRAQIDELVERESELGQLVADLDGDLEEITKAQGD